MSLFIPLKRTTLLIPSGPAHDLDRKHLFILLTDPAANELGVKSVLMVSLSSIKNGIPYDTSCVLSVGDHPFVKKDSFVLYRFARIEEADKVLRGVKAGKLIPLDSMRADVFLRVCNGLKNSKETPEKIKNFYLQAIL